MGTWEVYSLKLPKGRLVSQQCVIRTKALPPHWLISSAGQPRNVGTLIIHILHLRWVRHREAH